MAEADPRIRQLRRRRIVVMEFNELCPSLLDRWMGEGRLPNFARLHRQSDVFVTDADVVDPGQLEPWIQWYSAHTGLAYDQHHVFHLTDGPRAGHTDIYQTLLAAGRRVGSFASMNVAPFASPGSFFVGDPWSENGDAFPPDLNIYNRFVARQVREYSNAKQGMGAGELARFLSFMTAYGLRASTVSTILRQLAAERTVDRRLSYRRAALLDRLQFDVFRALYESSRPDFATFFLNSTAHLQHSYWRHMEPQAFKVQPSADEVAIYGDAVRFGYEAMDRLVGDFLALADRRGAALMFMTALSQQPFLHHEDKGGQHFHRLHKVEDVLHRLGIDYLDVDPTMTHQYLARFATPGHKVAARERLEALALEDGRPLFDFARIGTDETALYFGCQISTKVPRDATILDRRTGERLPFFAHFYQIEAIKSGRHHPNGALWLRTGSRGRAHADHVSILDVFPTLLDLLGVRQPTDAPRRGHSLAPILARDMSVGRAA